MNAAINVGPILLEPRRVDKNVSMADAVMLVTARDESAKLVSNDRAFAGHDDVIRP